MQVMYIYLRELFFGLGRPENECEWFFCSAIAESILDDHIYIELRDSVCMDLTVLAVI